MSLVHGMLAGADSIDEMNVLRAGSTGLVLGHRVMAPSTLGTFLRAFTFGHVRQLDRVLDIGLARAWDAGAGPGELPLVIDLDSFIGEVHGEQKQGACYGYTRQLGYHPIMAVRADTGEVLHIRNRMGKANTQRGAGRFVDELLARVRRAGHTGQIIIRADSGFENHKLFTTLDRQGVEFSIGVEQSTQVRALIDEIPENDWVTITDYPDSGEAQIAETKLKGFRLIVRRTRLIGAQAELFPDWRHHCFATNRTVPTLIADIDHRDHATIELVIRDLKDQALAHFPSGQFNANSAWTVIAALSHNLGRWITQIGLPNQPVQTARIPPPAPTSDPRPPDPHQPHLDTPHARPLALATPVRHRAERDPGAPRAHLNTPTRRENDHQHHRPTASNHRCPKTHPNEPAHNVRDRHTRQTQRHDQRTEAVTRKSPKPASPTQPIGGFRLSGVRNIVLRAT